jgi:hypothetical protein
MGIARYAQLFILVSLLNEMFMILCSKTSWILIRNDLTANVNQ